MKITPKAKRNISRIIPFAIIWLAIGWIIDITALLLLCMIDGFSRFEDARSLASQVGICPRVYSSGSSVRGRGSICNLGSSKLRKLLYMCSWAAKTCNPACADLYKRMIQKGKPERVIKVAIAHKLPDCITNVFVRNAVWKHQLPV